MAMAAHVRRLTSGALHLYWTERSRFGMRSVISLLVCMLVLGLGVWRLALVDMRQFRSYHFRQSQDTRTPDSGSFVGINEKGEKEAAKVNGNGHLLVFVIHHERAADEVKFWNSVIRSVDLNRDVPAASIQYWGICDVGSECSANDQDARFSVLGYIDPWEMHIVAEADARNEDLLYGEGNILKAHIPRAQTVPREAQLVGQEARLQ